MRKSVEFDLDASRKQLSALEDTAMDLQRQLKLQRVNNPSDGPLGQLTRKFSGRDLLTQLNTTNTSAGQLRASITRLEQQRVIWPRSAERRAWSRTAQACAFACFVMPMARR